MRFSHSEKRTTRLIYQSRIIDERYSEIIKKPLPFDNCEYEIRISGTISTDKRIMSFVNTFWGFEVTGGADQSEALTIIAVNRSGMARRAGIRVGDIIHRINNIYTDDMTLLQAQLLILRSGKHVQIFVHGDSAAEEDEEFTVDFWFKPPRKRFPAVKIENKWDGFQWNERGRPVYKESNCYMVPSKNEEKVFQHDKQHKKPDPVPLTVTESDDNTTDISETNRKPLVVTESDDNTTAISDTNKKTAEELNAEE